MVQAAGVLRKLDAINARQVIIQKQKIVANIAGEARYDLLLLDYDLPGVDGIQLTQHARGLDHRSQTPIVILSAMPIDAAARDAGADAFLRKPEDLSSLAETIT